MQKITSFCETPPHRVLLVAPSPPPYGGMALQGRLLEKMLCSDGNYVVFCSSNVAFPEWLGFLDRLPWLRTFPRSAIIWMKLWKQVRQVEIVHVLAASWLYFFAVVSPAVILGRVFRKRVVLNFRGGEAREFFRWWSWAAKPVFKLAHSVTAPSDFLAKVIGVYFHVPVLIVPNILDASVFTYKQRITIRPKMLVARHLEKTYDIESVLKAYRMVKKHYPEASLWIAGTGSQEAYLRRLVSTWKLEGVRFLGHIGHEALPAIYDQCDILLNASRVDNFPGALIEASAAGLIVVSTSAGGIPFTYQNGKNALLVEPGDWPGLGGAVLRLLECPSLASGLATAAAALARKCVWGEVRRCLYRAYGFELEKGDNNAVMSQPAGKDSLAEVRIEEGRCIAG